MVLGNISIKFNAKLEGSNHHVESINAGSLRTRTMIVGIDVTHPGQGCIKETPSIAAVVASVDPQYTVFPGTFRLQGRNKDGKPQEIVQNLSGMMDDCLRTFERRNRAYPNQILVYRDGVFESQYDQVIKIEFPQIVAACKAVNPKGYRPPITILVVGKRHHTRTFNTAPSGNGSKVLVGSSRENTPPGTVVDRVIIGKHEHAFLLQSHSSHLETVSLALASLQLTRLLIPTP